MFNKSYKRSICFQAVFVRQVAEGRGRGRSDNNDNNNSCNDNNDNGTKNSMFNSINSNDDTHVIDVSISTTYHIILMMSMNKPHYH